jgi:putative ABC transport system permease protein
MGYDKDKLLVLPVAPENFTSLKTEFLTNPRVISVAGSQNHIGFGSYRRPVKDQDKQLEVDVMDIGPEYAGTIGLRLVDGRLFDEMREAADRENNSIIVNQKMLDDFGWKEGVGKVLTLYDTTKLNVIGVVKDFYIGGLWQEVEPAMLRLARNDNYYIMVVRANSGDLPGVLDFMESKWKTMVPNSIFGGRPQEELMQEAKDINNSILKVNVFLAIIATILSLIGMFNLVSLDIIKRTKEVGIRKIQGAPVPLIMLLISKKFLIILAFAAIVGCAGGYYMSYMLLDSIWDYFVEISPGILIVAVLIMIVATILTLFVKIAKAAMRNPAVSLRYE